MIDKDRYTQEALIEKELDLRKWVQRAYKLWLIAGLPLFLIMILAAYGIFPLPLIMNGYIYLVAFYAIWAVTIIAIVMFVYWLVKIMPINKEKAIRFGGKLTVEDYKQWLEAAGFSSYNVSREFARLSTSERVRIWNQLNEEKVGEE